MLYAKVDGVKATASPKLVGHCFYCESKMIPKCGKIKQWHWSHSRIAICDTWTQPETEWHRNWKSIFGKDNSEIIIIQNGKKHIADVKTKNGTVIEFQNSKISYDTVVTREQFYGENMIWIINAINYKTNFTVKDNDFEVFDTYTPEFEKYAKINGFSTKYKPDSDIDSYLRFSWKKPPESWTASKRKVYLDFGTENLFCVASGMGKVQGIGYEMSKIDFIKSYDGNEALALEIFNLAKE